MAVPFRRAAYLAAAAVIAAGSLTACGANDADEPNGSGDGGDSGGKIALPPALSAPRARNAAHDLGERRTDLAGTLASALGTPRRPVAPGDVEVVLDQVLAGYQNLRVAATRQAAVLGRLEAMAPFVARAPMVGYELADVDRLLELARAVGA